MQQIRGEDGTWSANLPQQRACESLSPEDGGERSRVREKQAAWRGDYTADWRMLSSNQGMIPNRIVSPAVR